MYTREAHPGESVGPHHELEEKLAAARRLRDEVGIRRPILVDDLAGTVHRAYGWMWNMTYMTGRRGMVLYRAAWTSAARIEEFLERYGRGPESLRETTFYSEQVEIRRQDKREFYRLLERNGPRAVAEFARAEEFWAEQERQRRRESTRAQPRAAAS